MSAVAKSWNFFPLDTLILSLSFLDSRVSYILRSVNRHWFGVLHNDAVCVLVPRRPCELVLINTFETCKVDVHKTWKKNGQIKILGSVDVETETESATEIAIMSWDPGSHFGQLRIQYASSERLQSGTSSLQFLESKFELDLAAKSSSSSKTATEDDFFPFPFPMEGDCFHFNDWEFVLADYALFVYPHVFGPNLPEFARRVFWCVPSRSCEFSPLPVFSFRVSQMIEKRASQSLKGKVFLKTYYNAKRNNEAFMFIFGSDRVTLVKMDPPILVDQDEGLGSCPLTGLPSLFTHEKFVWSRDYLIDWNISDLADLADLAAPDKPAAFTKDGLQCIHSVRIGNLRNFWFLVSMTEQKEQKEQKELKDVSDTLYLCQFQLPRGVEDTFSPQSQQVSQQVSRPVSDTCSLKSFFAVARHSGQQLDLSDIAGWDVLYTQNLVFLLTSQMVCYFFHATSGSLLSKLRLPSSVSNVKDVYLWKGNLICANQNRWCVMQCFF